MGNKKIKNEEGTNEERTCVYLFAGYLRGYLFAGCFPAKQKYLPIFADFCEHKKRYYQVFRLILWIDEIKELAYLLPESVQTSVLLVCALIVACESS